MKKRGFEVVVAAHRQHPGVNIQLPRRAEPGACASDVFSPIETIVTPGDKLLIWLDIKAYMQNGEVAVANVRSSQGKVLVRLADTQGWIDQSYYCNKNNDGNIGIHISNEGIDPYHIAINQRIAQIMFIPYLIPDNDNPIYAERTGGFGSSGK